MKTSLFRAIAFLLVQLSLMGCANVQKERDQFRAQLRAWVGRPADSLVTSSLGAPNSTYQMSGGGTVLRYVWHEKGRISGLSYDCEMNFQVDSSGVIRDIRYKGSGGTVYDNSEDVCDYLVGRQL